jgi:hypothetical protein
MGIDDPQDVVERLGFAPASSSAPLSAQEAAIHVNDDSRRRH